MDEPSGPEGSEADRSPSPTLASSELVRREVEVLRLAAEGLPVHGISLLLQIPWWAVQELQCRAAWRLGAADLEASIQLARRRRLIQSSTA